MAEYDIVDDFTSRADTVNNGVNTVDSGIHDLNEVTNIVEYSRIYHDPNASDADRREAMKKMAYSIGYFGNKIPATSGGAYFDVFSSSYFSDGLYFADKDSFIKELNKQYDPLNPYSPQNEAIEYMIDHPDESYEAYCIARDASFVGMYSDEKKSWDKFYKEYEGFDPTTSDGQEKIKHWIKIGLDRDQIEKMAEEDNNSDPVFMKHWNEMSPIKKAAIFGSTGVLIGPNTTIWLYRYAIYKPLIEEDYSHELWKSEHPEIFAKDAEDVGSGAGITDNGASIEDVDAGAGIDGYGEEIDDDEVRRRKLTPLKPAYDRAKSAVVVTYADPLVLDLDGHGLDISKKVDGANFDLDKNGFAERMNWTKTDGFLCLDRNNNGSIDNGGELFGDQTALADGNKAKNGFEALAQYDKNGDGIIDANDEIFSELRVWVDADGDAKTGEGELKTLAELGITSINLNAQAAEGELDSEAVYGNVATFTTADGTERTIGEIWVSRDLFDTIETAQLDVPDDIAALPDVAAIGNAHSLRTAMALDETGTLKGYVEEFLSAESYDDKRAAAENIVGFISGAEVTGMDTPLAA